MTDEVKKTRKNEFHLWVQTATGILSIGVIAGGAVIALFQSQPVRIAAAVFCAGIVGYGAYKRKWLAVAAPLIALITLVALAPSPTPNTTAQSQQPQVTQTSQPNTPTSTTTTPTKATQSSQNNTPEPMATFDLVLKPHDAADIDATQPVVSINQSGATGGNDVFLYTNPVASPRIYINNSSPLIYPQNTMGDEYNACANKLSPNSGASRYDWSGVSIDTKICFYTSEKNMAYAAITGVDHPNGAEPPRSVTLHVIVWKKP